MMMLARLSLFTATAALATLTGCSITQPNTPIAHAHTNITTSLDVSTNTASLLIASGYTQADCMEDFDNCVSAIKDSVFEKQLSRPTLVTLSELYYAYARHLNNTDACSTPIRPPIDEYYANAPISDDEKQARIDARNTCLEAYKKALFYSIDHSYAYLFYDDLTGTHNRQRIVREDDIKAKELYHIASHAIIDEIYKQRDGAFSDNPSRPAALSNNPYGQLFANRYQSGEHSVNLFIANDPYYTTHLAQGDHLLSDLVSIYDNRLAKLNTTSTRSGLGVSYVGVLPSRHTLNIKNALNTTHADNPAERIHPMGYILLTGVARPKGNTLDEVLTSKELDVYFFNPHVTKNVQILGKDYPLAANFSSNYALWLAENQLNQVSLINMLKKERATKPELYMLEPYNPNKKVVIMIHGLASSPATWVNFTNNLLSDPILRDNYQVWQVFYATNLPILENRYQIQELIKTAYAQTDPTGTHPASRHSVLIGHSMGGLISRMMLSDDNLLPRLNELAAQSDQNSLFTAKDLQLHEHNIRPPNTQPISDNQIDAPIHLETTSLSDGSVTVAPVDATTNIPNNSALIKKLLHGNHKEEISNRFILQSLPQVDTAVFISSPFRGTDYAERWFTRLARRIIRLPLDITGAVSSIGDNSGIQDSTVGSLYLQNGASQLSDRSTFIALTQDISINPRVRYHTIMGDHRGILEDKPTPSTTQRYAGSIPIVTYEPSGLGDAVGSGLSDGVVPYKSSHLDGAISETIITGGHSIHENPKTVRELRRILHAHLASLPPEDVVRSPAQ